MELIQIVLAVVTSLFVSLLITGLVVRYGKKLKLIDDPKTHKHPKVVHTQPVPRGGGIAIFCAVAVGSILYLPLEPRIIGILGGMVILVVVGYLDDRYQELVSPYARLFTNALAAMVVIGTGVGIAYITNPLGGVINLDGWQWCFGGADNRHCVWILADLFALVWLVWMQNIIGWSSGVDGQLPGFVIVAAITIGLLAVSFGSDPSQYQVVILAAITAGAYLGFLAWNWFPQRIIPGYGGKSMAGFLLGVLAILSGAKVGALAMVLGIPFLDAAWVMLKRIREGRSPVWGGREHLHHYLLAMGWGKRRIAGFYWGMSVLLAILALQLKAASKYFTIAAIILVVSGVILWLHYFSTYLKQPDQDSG